MKNNRRYEADFRLPVLPLLGLFLAWFSFCAITFEEHDELAVLSVLVRNETKFFEWYNYEMPSLIEIDLYDPALYGGGSGFLFGRMPASLAQIDQRLAHYANLNKNTGILIRSTTDALHGQLIQVLNLAYKNQMNNLILISIDMSVNTDTE